MSGPISFCNSPIASMSARRAFARASTCAAPCDAPRSETADRLSSPTATIVNRIISERVTTKAKPPGRGKPDRLRIAKPRIEGG
jgi:hypothetical protein